jgi:hypothetical protein
MRKGNAGRLRAGIEGEIFLVLKRIGSSPVAAPCLTFNRDV